MVSAAGTGNTPTFRRHATVGGVPGGRGTQLRPPPPRKDLSRKADLLGDRAWDCPFPVEADASGVNGGVVALMIWIRSDGRAQNVQVVSDPGHGFGREARQCALSHHYRPARDSDGKSIPATLGPIRIRFTR
jgi:protein TonB